MRQFLLRHKRLVKLLAFPVVALMAFLVWREWRYRSIPDVGPPFDVEAFLAEYDDSENAHVYYTDTLKELKALELKVRENDGIEFEVLTWEQVTPETRVELEKAKPILEKWMQGNHLSRMNEVHPLEATTNTLIPVTQYSRMVVHMLLLEAARLRSEGKSDEEWERYHAVLNISQQLRSSFLVSYFSAVGRYADFSHQFHCFLSDPALTTTRLKQLSTELQNRHEKHHPFQDTLKIDYITSQNALRTAPQMKSFLFRVTNEDKILKRLNNLFYQNWFTYDTLPIAKRPAFKQHSCDAYQRKPSSFRVIESLKSFFFRSSKGQDCYFRYFDDAETNTILDQASHRLTFSKKFVNDIFLGNRAGFNQMPDLDYLYQDVNLTQIGLHIYYREHGKFPETLAELVPNYVKQLPRTPDKKGAILDYLSSTTGKVLQTPDQTYVFQVYEPGTDLSLLKRKKRQEL